MAGLTGEQMRILRAVAGGWTLKAHRDVEGGKIYRLYPLEGLAEVVRAEAVLGLVERGLLDSNKKFPAATFWLTERGQEAAEVA
jgi:hypothetical protein